MEIDPNTWYVITPQCKLRLSVDRPFAPCWELFGPGPAQGWRVVSIPALLRQIPSWRRQILEASGHVAACFVPREFHLDADRRHLERFRAQLQQALQGPADAPPTL